MRTVSDRRPAAPEMEDGKCGTACDACGRRVTGDGSAGGADPRIDVVVITLAKAVMFTAAIELPFAPIKAKRTKFAAA